jgi:hypothetical protein
MSDDPYKEDVIRRDIADSQHRELVRDGWISPIEAGRREEVYNAVCKVHAAFTDDFAALLKVCQINILTHPTVIRLLNKHADLI